MQRSRRWLWLLALVPVALGVGLFGFSRASAAGPFCHGLYVKVRFLLAHPKEVRRIGVSGRRTARRVFGGERFVAEWEAILAEAVSGTRLSAAVGGAGK